MIILHQIPRSDMMLSPPTLCVSELFKKHTQDGKLFVADPVQLLISVRTRRVHYAVARESLFVASVPALELELDQVESK